MMLVCVCVCMCVWTRLAFEHVTPQLVDIEMRGTTPKEFNVANLYPIFEGFIVLESRML
jgi:hypothetical protein